MISLDINSNKIFLTIYMFSIVNEGSTCTQTTWYFTWMFNIYPKNNHTACPEVERPYIAHMIDTYLICLVAFVPCHA